MPQFAQDGPEIPAALLQAQESDRLVIFAGAGASKRAGLPLFGELVDKLVAKRLIEMTPQLAGLRERNELDRLLSLLETQIGFEGLRQDVCELLTPSDGADLSSHAALVALATGPSKALRLVTTNFDTLFEASAPSIKSVATAPRLPIPKPDKWDALVHLHGCIGDRDDPHHKALVLTSRDFGVAYLTEGWASRFLAELFSRFSVLFVGYAVEDPVMRYMVDAIAAERMAGTVDKPAFVLAAQAATSDETATAKERWLSMGLQPILYAPENGHESLHQTLRAWAHLWTGGLRSRLNIIADLASKSPKALTSEQVSQFVWALGEEDGTAARHLAELVENPDADHKTADWLEELERNALVPSYALRDPDGESPLVSRHDLRDSRSPLHPILRGLSFWISRQLTDPRILLWVIGHGCALHPEFGEIIRLRLQQHDTEYGAVLQVWRSLVAGLPIGRPARWNHTILLGQQLSRQGWGPGARFRLLEALTPWVELDKAWDLSWLVDAEAGKASDLVRTECHLNIQMPEVTLVEPLKQSGMWDVALRDVALDLPAALRSALELQAEFASVAEDWDWSSPVASEDDEVRRAVRGDWELLVDMNRDALATLVRVDDKRADQLVAMWARVPFPAARRLLLFAVRAYGPRYAAVVWETMRQEPRVWLWSRCIRHDVIDTLPGLYSALPSRSKLGLLATILAGPSRESHPGVDDSRWRLINDRWISSCLLTLSDKGPGPQAGVMLADIQRRHPEWFAPRARPEINETPPPDLEQMTDDAVIGLLNSANAGQELLDEWAKMVARNPARRLALLGRLSGLPNIAASVWVRALQSFPLGEIEASSEGLLDAVELLPEPLLADRDLVQETTSALSRIATRADAATKETRIVAVWERLVRQVLPGEAKIFGGDVLGEAINAPIGKMTETMLSLVRAHMKASQKDRASALLPHFEALLDSGDGAREYVQTILCSRLALLNDVSPDWVAKYLVPLFDWRQDREAANAWRGFLWSPLLTTGLWMALRKSFLEAFNHYGELGQFKGTLPKVLASIGIDGDRAIEPAETASCLRRLDDESRAQIAFWIQERLRGAGDKAGTLWRERIGPWMRESWPAEPGLKGEKTTQRLAYAVFYAGEAITDALNTVTERLARIADPSLVLYEIRKRELAERMPREALILLDAVVSDHPIRVIQLSPLLDAIEGGVESGAADPMLKRLRQISLRLGA